MTRQRAFGVVEQSPSTAEREGLVRILEALSSRTRLDILDRLARPAFASDLAKELDITRQALAKHLEALKEVDLIVARPAHKGAQPATEYVANPGALFAFKESVQSLARAMHPSRLPPLPTLRAQDPREDSRAGGPGLLLVHGDVPGRWFSLATGSSWVLGRDPHEAVALSYDPFASARHALLRREGAQWSITDLESTNGTLVNFRPMRSGSTRSVRDGDLITVGHSHLLLREGL